MVKSYNENEPLNCAYCGRPQWSNAGYFVDDLLWGASSEVTVDCEHCSESFRCWRNEEGRIEVDKRVKVTGEVTEEVVEPIITVNQLTRLARKIKWPHIATVALLSTLLWFQVGESPASKVASEWVACNKVYADKCWYAGSRFATDSWEMFIAQKLYGVSDNKISKLRKRPSSKR